MPYYKHLVGKCQYIHVHGACAMLLKVHLNLLATWHQYSIGSDNLVLLGEVLLICSFV